MKTRITIIINMLPSETRATVTTTAGNESLYQRLSSFEFAEWCESMAQAMRTQALTEDRRSGALHYESVPEGMQEPTSGWRW